MRKPLNTASNDVAFTIRIGYERQAYIGSLDGGGHYPTTMVIEIYEDTDSNKDKE